MAGTEIELEIFITISYCRLNTKVFPKNLPCAANYCHAAVTTSTDFLKIGHRNFAFSFLLVYIPNENLSKSYPCY